MKAVPFAVVGLVFAISAGCGGEDAIEEVVLEPTGCAGYEERGPYDVGMTTLVLDGEPVEVWYPASPGAADGLDTETYDMREWLPAEAGSMISDEDTPLFEMDAVRDLPVATTGPFPVVLFSHGMGGYRMQSSVLMVHLASWGFVVAAPEHPERGLSVLVETGAPSGDNGPDTMRATYALLGDENGRADGLFAGAIDLSRVAATGHSAGGGAVLDIAADPEYGFATWMTFASGGFGTTGGPEIPSFMMAGTNDEIANATNIELAFERQAPNKRYLAVADMGHLGFTDICAIGSDRGGVLQIAIDAGIEVPEILLVLGRDGCEVEEGDLVPEAGWPVVNHYTTAHLMEALDVRAQSDGLGDDAATCFGGLVATYIHD
jgi:dienelactone hydrolase